MVQEGELAINPSASSPDSTLDSAHISTLDSVSVSSHNSYLDLTPLPGNAIDTVVEVEPLYGLVMTADPADSLSAPPLRGDSLGMSFILTGLFLLFLVIALRFRNNLKYALTMFRNLVETRTRHNVFDDTVRETSLIVMLNILWIGCAGILGYSFYETYESLHEVGVGWMPSGLNRSVGMLSGMGLAAVYALFMWGAYGGVGWIFSDRSHADLWVKGYLASQALMAPALFLAALVAICRPPLALEAAAMGGLVFIFVKLIFIWKGFRIFFSQFSSWVLFLCYLCSLEIVPLILCCRLAPLLGTML
ncbi:MAG: DUF4271 domain-containing protein [Muribaculaceae bacterium]|nr:DUF4271 domain-containing protein [Muribaculaceae bacterium]